MTLDSIRISLRLHRFELITLVLATVAAIGAAFWIASSLDALDVAKACLPNPATGSTTPLCDRVSQEFNDIAYGRSSAVSLVLNMLPVIGGLILGASVIGREVERGTTRLAWSLTPSRLPWFIARSIPPLVVLVVASVLMGLAADRMAAAKYPDVDVTKAFVDMGTRGLVLAGHAIAAYGLGAATGAVLGRELPGFVLALVALVGVLIGVARSDQALLAAEAIYRDGTANGEVSYQGDLYIDQEFRLPDGRLVDYQEAYPQGQAIDDNGNLIDPYPMVDVIVPGECYSFATARSAAELALVGLTGLVVAAGAAVRRGPGN